MAEHDEIARQAAEKISFYMRTIESIAIADLPRFAEQLLAPFFAAARKEAREGALEEAIKACNEGLPGPDEPEPARKHFASTVRLCKSAIVALRSKPKEPA